MKKPSYSTTVFLVLCTVYLFGSAHLGAYLYDHVFQSGSVSANETKIAGLKLSNDRNNETTNKLLEEINLWKETQNLSITYMEVGERIPSEAFQFDVDATVDMAVDGEDSPLLLQVDEGLLRELLISLGMDIESIQIDKLKDAITERASTLDAEEREFALEDFLNSPGEMKVLAEKKIGNVESTPGLQEFLAESPEILIEPVSTFSLLKFVEDMHISMTNKELSVISTGLYEILLHSDLEVIQRHHSRSLPDYAELGMEARVDKDIQQDFVFVNPNNQVYKIHFQLAGDTILFSLEGAELPYEVEISLQNKQTVEPRVIKQYSPYVDQGQPKVKAEGKDGVQIEVWRRMLDSKGSVLKEELISRDYYPPVHREELVSLKDYVSSKDNSGSESGDTVSSTGTSDVEAPESNQQEKDDSGNEKESDERRESQQKSPEAQPSPSEDSPNPNMK
ncbi:VanW family protein [Rossellomorea oryzaecorticis]|uniref:VanW family protein n=1 Tax=Rossellomorea oryzaecorticis TaxID=1396505 RepID=A0ABU9KE69_9BACI